jgi:hypothetical protein
LASLLFGGNVFAASAASGADSFWHYAEKVSRLSECKKAAQQKWSQPKVFALLRT